MVERDERLSRMKTSRGNLSDGNVEGKQLNDLGGVNKQQGPNSIRLNEKINGSGFYETENEGSPKPFITFRNDFDGI